MFRLSCKTLDASYAQVFVALAFGSHPVGSPRTNAAHPTCFTVLFFNPDDHIWSFKSYPNEGKKIRRVVFPNNDFRKSLLGFSGTTSILCLRSRRGCGRSGYYPRLSCNDARYRGSSRSRTTSATLRSSGDQVSAEIADVVFPIMTKARTPFALATTGTTLVLKKPKDHILSLAALLKAGFKVTFAVGTPQDPNFGGILISPTGARATLDFKDNLVASLHGHHRRARHFRHLLRFYFNLPLSVLSTPLLLLHHLWNTPPSSQFVFLMIGKALLLFATSSRPYKKMTSIKPLRWT